jgi:hypothetical protein
MLPAVSSKPLPRSTSTLRLNQGARWLALTLMPGAAGLLQSAPLNMLDLLAHPEAARRDRRLMADR